MTGTALAPRRRGGKLGWGRRVAVLAALVGQLSLAACNTLGQSLEETANSPDVRSGYLPSQARQPISFEGIQQNDPQSSIGRSQHPRILSMYGGAYSDERLERALAGIVGRLSAVSDDPGRAYRITILDSPNVNAFALPGGYLYVTRGLLALANDSAEVAAVIAHEMAHVAANHGIQRQQREQAAEIADRVVTEVLAGDPAGRAAMARQRLSLASFSRNQELEADVLGIRQIGRAGYDTFAAARFLQAMESYSRFRNAFQAPNAELDFLASHPAAPQRVRLAETAAAEFGPRGNGSTDRDRYLNGIDGMLFGDTATEGYVRERDFFHPSLGIGFRVPEGFIFKNETDAVLVEGPGDVAVRFDGVALPQDASLTDYVASGWIGGLDRASVRPLRVNGLEGITARAASGAYVFNVSLVRVGGQVYRFLIAVPAASSDRLDALSQSIAGTFRVLSATERAALKPLRIRVVTASASDTQTTLAARMQGVDRRADLLRLLNDLEPNSPIEAGQRYKIIAE